jgi:hypothetical protein
MNRIASPIVADTNSDGELPVPQLGGEDGFVAVREYVQGDNLRSIHWRALARQQRWVVKEYERSDRPILLVVLDCRAEFNCGEGARTTFEYAVSIAASMIRLDQFRATLWLISVAVVIYLILPRFPAGNLGVHPGSNHLYENKGWEMEAETSQSSGDTIQQANTLDRKTKIR